MKNFLSLACVVSVCALAMAGTAAQAQATAAEYYTLDANGNDSLGLANLTATGSGITFNATGGMVNGYMHLAGTGGYLLANLNTGSAFSALGDYSTFHPFSVTFWVRQTAAQAASGTQAVFGMTTATTNTSVYNTGFEVITREASAGIGLEVRCRNAGSGDTTGQILTNVNVSDGNWHHVAVVFEAGDRFVYIDGVLAGTNNTPVAITTNPICFFAMGAFLRAGSVLDNLNGDIDDFQVYQGSLSPTDIQQLYQNPGQTLVNQPLAAGTAPADIVDPMIGVAGGLATGSCVPGVCLPQSSIYASPDTESAVAGGFGAGSPVVGFSQLHAQGSGSSVLSYGNFLVSPRLGAGLNESDNASPVENVVAHPYEYSCELSTWGINCVVAPTANCAIYQFTFPPNTDSRINFDVARKLASTTGLQTGTITIDPVNGIISGGGLFTGNWNPAAYQAFFYAQVDTTPQSSGTFIGSTVTTGVNTASTATPQHLGGWLSFNTETNQTVHLKIAVSFNSVAQAQKYLQAEIPAWDIGAAETSAKNQWNSALGALQTPGIGADDARKLYTSVFHSLITPRNRTGDPQNYPASSPFWDDHFTCWDTWQTLYPLLSIIRPASVASIVNSFGERYLINGRAETAFTAGQDYQTGQGGDEVDRIICDAYERNIPGINWANAWQLLQFNANRRTADYRSLGYVTTDGSKGGYDSRLASGSSTMAFASGDWCAAQVGFSQGATAVAQTLLNRSENWQNVWDPTLTSGGFSGFIRGRAEDGKFTTTSATTSSGTDFYEGTPWGYSFLVSHDRDQLVGLMGGRNRFIQRLEFALKQGSTSYIDFTNEPAFSTPSLFVYANRPYLSSYWADQSRQLFGEYTEPGDDDSGAMASWYFFLTAGMYPIATQPVYYLHGTRVPEIQLSSGSGTFTITGANTSAQNIYVQSATLNGQPLNTPMIHQSDIAAGSTLAYVMGPNPTIWGTGTDFTLPAPSNLVLPVSGTWTPSLGSPTITNATTASPTWGSGTNGAGNTAIYSGFPAVTLQQAGDAITLSGTVQMNGLAPVQSAPATGFAWGLFNNSGQNGVTGWPGYLAANDTVNTAGTQWLCSKPSGDSNPFYSSTGASQLESFALPTPSFTSGIYYFTMTISLNSSNALDYSASLVRASDGTLFSAFTGSDPSPTTLSFNSVGLRLGNGVEANSVQLTQVSVTTGASTFSDRNLVIPAGGVFYENGSNIAALTVGTGATLFPGSTIGTQSATSATFDAGSAMGIDLASDGSTGQAGTAWSSLAVSGALNFSGASAANPITISLATLSGPSTAGPLASWNPNSNHQWTGVITAAGGISGFSPQSFVFNTGGFQNPMAGTFSLQAEANGTTLDLIYTAPISTDTPTLPPCALLVLATLLFAIAVKASIREEQRAK